MLLGAFMHSFEAVIIAAVAQRGEVHGYSYVRKKYHWIIGEMHLELFSQILA